MPILYDKAASTLTLHTAHTTYQMKVMHHGLLIHTYYGPRCEGDMSYLIQYRDRGFSGNPFDAGMDRTVSCDVLPLEYPCEGNGDYRHTAFGARDMRGVSGCDLRYVSHTIVQGKYSLPGMPAVFASDEEAQTLRVELRDERLPVKVTLLYGVLPERDCITRSVIIRNAGQEDVVLDDGWFGRRSSDHDGLGDWQVNEAKLGCTMHELVARVKSLGMRFGLWIEPEMVNMASDLFRQHPDWAFIIPGKQPVRSRDQLVLDFSRREVVDNICSQLFSVLDGSGIDYIKMDMNRSINDVYSAVMERQSQGKVLYKYVLGVYDFMERLRTRYPAMLIEGCSGGGGRFDAGMLYYTPQIWCSDMTDAIERIRIQYGTSFGYPVHCMGAHVSVSPEEVYGWLILHRGLRASGMN